MSENVTVIVRRLAGGELVEVLPDGSTRPHVSKVATDWARLEAMDEETLERAIAADPDWQGVPMDWVDRAEFALPEPKKQISLRVDAEVLRWFKSHGPGYQTRMNAVLKSYMRAKDQRRARRTRR